MIDRFEAGDGDAQTAYEDAILTMRGLHQGHFIPQARLLPRAVARPEGTDPIDPDGVRTVRGYSLTMFEEELLSVDSGIGERLAGIPDAKFSEETMRQYHYPYSYYLEDLPPLPDTRL